MARKPLLSVAMPVHDGAQWIGAALDSLAATAGEEIEIIVIDSSPGDCTAAIVETYLDRLPVRLLRRPDLGPWQVKTNLGMELATAEYACILHQDDLWLPNRLSAVRRWLDAAPEAIIHLAPSVYVDRRGRPMGPWQCPLPAERKLDSALVLERLLVQNFVSVPGPVFSRKAWLQCGGMDGKLWYTADWDIWLKLASNGEVVYHNETTTAFRIHGGSLTVTGSLNPVEFREQMQIVFDRYIDRIPAENRQRVKRVARASINVNVLFASASRGDWNALIAGTANILSLGPAGIRRYLRDSRIRERVMSRLRARLAGAF